MAITAVPSSQAAQATTARGAVLPAKTQHESLRNAQPSTIASISPEGKLRAAQDRQPVAVPTAPASNEAPNKPSTVNPANALPRRTPIEEATDTAAIAALAVQAQNTNLPPHQLNDAQPAEQAVKAVATTVRHEQQPERDTPAASKPERTTTPAPATNSVAAPLPASAAPARAAPDNAPVEQHQLTRNAVAPAHEAPRVANIPAENTPLAHAPATNTALTENHVNRSRITQTAHDFVAAIHQQQSRRSQVKQSAASVSQAQTATAPEPRSAVPSNVRNESARVENVARSAEVVSARAASATVASGVVSAPQVQSSSQGNAAVSVTRDETTAHAHSAVARGEQSPTPASASSHAPAPAESISQIQANSVAAKQRAQTARQNSAALSLSNQAGGASVDQGDDLAKHLNALANLLTP